MSKFRYRKFIMFSIIFIFSSFCYFLPNGYANKTNRVKNIFSGIPKKMDREHFETLLHTNNVIIDRVLSNGQKSFKNKPYHSIQDQWIMVLQGSANLKVEGETAIVLARGDYYFIPAGKKHWVLSTSKQPKTIWLVVNIFKKPLTSHQQTHKVTMSSGK